MNSELRHLLTPGSQSLRAEFDLAATPAAVRLARRFTEVFLHNHGLSPITDVACLMVSELTTNAVLACEPLGNLACHTDGLTTAIRICLDSNGQRLRIEVWDQAAGFPVLRQAHADSESGRGLTLIGAMTEGHWGWHRVAVPWAAKCVWAEICHPASETPLTPPTPTLHHSNPETGRRNMTAIETELASPAAPTNIEASLRELVAPRLFSGLTCRVMTVDGYDQDTAERIVEQALAFLVACARYPDGHLMPSPAVDAGWHAFILHTADYAEFCQQVAGRFIHHRPSGPGEAAPGPQAIGVTIAAMRGAGLPVDPDLWVPAAECSQCYQGCADDPRGA